MRLYLLIVVVNAIALISTTILSHVFPHSTGIQTASETLSLVDRVDNVFPAASACYPRGLRFRDGHRSTLQEAGEQCAIYLQAAVVADKTLFSECIHKFTYPRSGGTNHLRQGCL